MQALMVGANGAIGDFFVLQLGWIKEFSMITGSDNERPDTMFLPSSPRPLIICIATYLIAIYAINTRAIGSFI
jgi:hypothetical protein